MNETMRLRGVRRRTEALVVGLVVVLCAGTFACGPGKLSTTGGLPECPVSGEWSTFFAKNYLRQTVVTGGTAGQLSLPGPITDIPEFHDCQRFLVSRNGATQFDSLYAIFARFHLDSLPADDSIRGLDHTEAPMGIIYSFHGAYPPLGIEPEFNCLYFVGSPTEPSGYAAKVVPVGNQQAECSTSSTAPGTTLRVDRIEMPGADSSDYPPVARWDWDAKHGTQYIGIRCGRAWCEVHPQDELVAFASSPLYTRTGTVQFRRSVEVKGWYDEQRLALPPSGAGNATPSSIMATFIPDSALGEGDDTTSAGSRFESRWVRVATVALGAPPEIYASKLNLVQSPAPDPVNVVHLCFGPLDPGGNSSCFTDRNQIPKCVTGAGGGWWGMIGADGAPPKFYCITRRTHHGIRIPGVVRWRWTLHDDTMWIRCLNGCCEVQPQT